MLHRMNFDYVLMAYQYDLLVAGGDTITEKKRFQELEKQNSWNMGMNRTKYMYDQKQKSLGNGSIGTIEVYT